MLGEGHETDGARSASKPVEVMVRASVEVIDRLDALKERCPNLTRAAIVRALIDAAMPLAESNPRILLGAAAVAPASLGVQQIRAERERQLGEKGYAPEHDDEHKRHELVWAAIHYLEGSTALPDLETGERSIPEGGASVEWLASDRSRCTVQFVTWPFDDGPSPAAKDQDDIRCLEKAGALIAAEIDRRLRARATSEAERAR